MKDASRPLAEPWLRGPLEAIQPLLMPAAHALTQINEDLVSVIDGLTIDQLWARPGGAPSIAFHLRHIAGSIDRLLTYTAGQSLNERQLQFLKAEETVVEPRMSAGELLAAATTQINRALAVICATAEIQLLQPRTVGRAALPTNVIGLLFHIAEHTQRHTGQIIATASVVRGLKL